MENFEDQTADADTVPAATTTLRISRDANESIKNFLSQVGSPMTGREFVELAVSTIIKNGGFDFAGRPLSEPSENRPENFFEPQPAQPNFSAAEVAELLKSDLSELVSRAVAEAVSSLPSAAPVSMPAIDYQQLREELAGVTPSQSAQPFDLEEVKAVCAEAVEAVLNERDQVQADDIFGEGGGQQLNTLALEKSIAELKEEVSALRAGVSQNLKILREEVKAAAVPAPRPVAAPVFQAATTSKPAPKIEDVKIEFEEPTPLWVWWSALAGFFAAGGFLIFAGLGKMEVIFGAAVGFFGTFALSKWLAKE